MRIEETHFSRPDGNGKQPNGKNETLEVKLGPNRSAQA